MPEGQREQKPDSPPKGANAGSSAQKKRGTMTPKGVRFRALLVYPVDSFRIPRVLFTLSVA